MKFISTSLPLIYIGSLYVTNADKGNMRGLHSNRDMLEQTTDETLDVFAEEQVGILEKETKDITNSHGSRSGSGSGSGSANSRSENKSTSKGKTHGGRKLSSGNSKSGKSRSRSRSRRDLGTVSEFDIIDKGATPLVETPVVVFEKKSYSGPSKGKGSSGSHYGYSYGSSRSKGKGSSRSHSSYGGYHHKVVEIVGTGSY